MTALFETSEKIYFSSGEFDLRLISKIPEVMALPRGKDNYVLILKENIQLPENLKKIIASEDVIIKVFELIKQNVPLDRQLKEQSKNERFDIQWVITNSNKKFWTTLNNYIFEYGEGLIEESSITVSMSVAEALKYFIQGGITLREMNIQGNYYQITIFEKIRKRYFYSEKDPLEYDINERLISIGYFKKEMEKKKESERKQQLRLKKKEEEKKRKQDAIKKQEKKHLYKSLRSQIEELTRIYDEIKITELEKKLPNYRPIFNKSFVALIEDMIINKDIQARIRGEYLTFITGVSNSKPDHIQKIITPQDKKKVTISRGGDWKIENNQSVFHYKVKVQNNSKFVLTNIQILLTSIPSGLISQSDRYLIDVLNPNSYESPTFKFSAKESCVGNKIKGVVIYTDPKGNPQTVSIQPFKIKYVCNLLVPKTIMKENYEKNIPSMHEQKISFGCKLSPKELEPEVSKILQHNNFYLLKNLNELKSPDFRKVKAYAEGKYDKEDVAVSIIMQTLADHTNKLVIKAMSNKEEKIMDLLKDISKKCDTLKSSAESIFPAEIFCTNCESLIILTDYMKSKENTICEKCGQEIKISRLL